MQWHIWELYLQTADDDVRIADERNFVQSIEQALYEPEQDYDYDPFAEPMESTLPHDGLDIGTQDKRNDPNSSPCDPILTPQQRHPNYGWGSRGIIKE